MCMVGLMEGRGGILRFRRKDLFDLHLALYIGPPLHCQVLGLFFSVALILVGWSFP
jgi:hypothetical protein